MDISKIDYNCISEFSSKDLSYINQEAFLQDFQAFAPAIEEFEKAIEKRKQFPVDRNLLVEELKKEYATINPTALQLSNIELLAKENTFTIITAHQPSLFGGPLYYVLKIASTINLCKQLAEHYPAHHFVPVFINGSEDHDFDEVNHLNIFGKTITWERQHGGPVGRMDLTGIPEKIDELADILGENGSGKEVVQLLRESLSASKTYNDFTFRFVNGLFGKHGLVVGGMDNASYKRAFAPIIKKELTERLSRPIVLKCQERLEENGFKAQAYPREINLFFLSDGLRERIEPAKGGYHLVDSDRYFSEKEMLQLLEDEPESFSPNVVIRPLYQEFIWPNLAYVGGGGEISYWLERKKQFEAFEVFYPMLIRRNSAMVLSGGEQKQLNKLAISELDLFKTSDEIIADYLRKNTSVEINLADQVKLVEEAYNQVAEKCRMIDPTLSKAVLAEQAKQLKVISQYESRIKRTLKSQEETSVNKIKKLKEKLFPNFGLQERQVNFLQFYQQGGEASLDYLVEHLDPLEKKFSIIYQ